MSLRTVFAFSGQGSQYYRMGEALWQRNARFRARMMRMDSLVQDLGGPSVLAALYAPERTKAEVFDRLALTHPAIFMVEWATAQLLIERGAEPDLVLGASLGTFTAAALAGCMDWETALTNIVRQAAVVEAHATPGGMIAVLAEPRLARDDELLRRSELAARHFDRHFVLAAKRDELALIEDHLAALEVTHQRLPVRYPFHSRWMDDIRPALRAATDAPTTLRAQLPVACCAAVEVLKELAPEHFWSVARRPIEFAALVARLEAEGGPWRYIDVGPAGTLATFLRYALPPGSRSEVFPTLTPLGSDLRNLDAIFFS